MIFSVIRFLISRTPYLRVNIVCRWTILKTAVKLTRLWRLLTKLQIVKPIFHQFYVERINETRDADIDMVSSDSISLHAGGKEILSDQEIVAAIAVSGLLPKATTLSLLLPLEEPNEESILLFNESRQVAVSTVKEIIEYYPITEFTRPVKIRMRRQVRDVRRLQSCPSDPMIYAAGSSTGEVILLEFSREEYVTLLTSRDAASRVTSLAFSSNGSRLGAADELGNIRIWIIDQIMSSQGFSKGVSPVQKFNVGRDLFAISFYMGCSTLLTAGYQKNSKEKTLRNSSNCPLDKSPVTVYCVYRLLTWR